MKVHYKLQVNNHLLIRFLLNDWVNFCDGCYYYEEEVLKLSGFIIIKDHMGVFFQFDGIFEMIFLESF
jgi:hypothetical protein